MARSVTSHLYNYSALPSHWLWKLISREVKPWGPELRDMRHYAVDCILILFEVINRLVSNPLWYFPQFMFIVQVTWTGGWAMERYSRFASSSILWSQADVISLWRPSARAAWPSSCTCWALRSRPLTQNKNTDYIDDMSATAKSNFLQVCDVIHQV